MVKVVCFVVGTDRALPVDIDAGQSVQELKEEIKAKYPDSTQSEVKNVELFLAKKADNEWLTGEDAAAVSLDEDGVVQGFEHMDPTLPLDNVKYFGGNFQPQDGQIHVLVVVPSAADKVTAGTTLTAELARVETEGPGQKRRRTEDVVAFTALAQTLDRATDLEVGKVLAVPREVFGISLDNGLYIRQEYWDLHAIIEKKLASDKRIRRVLVIGSPGIGKSVFGAFLLALLMTERKDVAYRPLGKSLIFFSWNATTSSYEISETPSAGKSYEGLFDGNEASALDSAFLHAFVFASLHDDNYKNLVKKRCFRVTMNPWTKEECQSLAGTLHLEDEDEWYHTFNLVGGKPKFLFAPGEGEAYDDLVARVRTAVPRSIDELKDQARLFQKKIFDDRAKHLLFLMYRDEEVPSQSFLGYASSVVETLVSTTLSIPSTTVLHALLMYPDLDIPGI